MTIRNILTKFSDFKDLSCHTVCAFDNAQSMKTYKWLQEDNEGVRLFEPQEGQTLYVWEYYYGILAEGGGLILVDDATDKIVMQEQFWIS